MSPALVAQIAGAAVLGAKDKTEWIALLNGKRSEDGYEVFVERFTIPEQFRGTAHADIPETVLDPSVVGVMHLHPWWSQATFSGIDDNSLNPRFPFSIVVSPSNNNLGFSYQAEGKVTLPCGAVGQVKRFMLAVEGVERFAWEAVRPEHSSEVEDLGDCHRFSEAAKDDYTLVETAECGLVTVADTAAVFGREGGAEFIAVVEKQTLDRKSTYFTKGDGKGNNNFTGNGGQGRRGKKRGGRFSAQKSGVYRVLDDDDDTQAPLGSSFDAPGGTFVFGGRGCDSCRATDNKRLRWHTVFETWLCMDCYEEADQVVMDCAKLEAAESMSNAYVETAEIAVQGNREAASRWKIC